MSDTLTSSASLSAYDILGVAPNATADDIRIAYRVAARRYHPDTNPDTDSRELFIQAKEAYELLSDADKRRKYDAVRKILQQSEEQKREREEYQSPWQNTSSISINRGSGSSWSMPANFAASAYIGTWNP